MTSPHDGLSSSSSSSSRHSGSQERKPVRTEVRQFGRFELLLRMGSGGMASVYLARLRGPEAFEKLVAIKKIHDHLTTETQFVDMFLDEARRAFPPDKTEAGAKALEYFEKNRDRMRYRYFRDHGYFIGSGVVEAACRTDVARRCKQSGMHWRFLNAAALCALAARFRSRLAHAGF